MKIPDDQTFHLKNLNQLCSEIKRLDLDIPIAEDFSLLGEQLDIGGKLMANRFCVQPMEGCDAQPDGSPGRLTFRRYTRYAQGGFGLIWLEATAVLEKARSNPAQLYLHKHNVEMYAELVRAIRKAALNGFGRDVIVVLQLAHSGRYSKPDGALKPIIAHHNPVLDPIQGISENYPLVTDDYLDRLQDTYVETARLAAEAGFDGVDMKSCHKDLLSGLLASFTKPGKYGGSFENRTRFLRETFATIKEDVPGLFLTTRMSVYDAINYPYGFGVDKDDYSTPDLTEPVKLVEMLRETGIPVLNISIGNPYSNPRLGRLFDIPAGDMSIPDEHPLECLDRFIGITRKIQRAFPDLPVVGCGYSWLRQFIPYVAAGVVKSGGAAIIGIGRGAFAYPEAVMDILETGRMEPTKCCITCSACIQLMHDGGMTGCVIRDSEIYGPEYRYRRRFALDHLREEACRCHYCEAATCTFACPAHIDIPAFVKAFADDDIGKAYEVIRRSNVLPEMCSQLCPTWMLCEGDCIETTLTGNSIPIRDIQYVICWLARDQGLAGISIPETRSGKKIAIVGGGPAGVACAVKLLEKGHNVVIIERDEQLGGMPQSIIRASRFVGAQAEIDAILQPALKAGRLEVRFGQKLGKGITLESLREQYNAVFLAAGLWQEFSLGKAEGVIDALTFLRKAKSGELKSIPDKVAILSGGDSAMDAAAAAVELGAVDLYVVYYSSFSEMHWHMPDGWFRTSGAHCLTLTQPVGYEIDENGKLTGLKICRTEPGPPDASGRRRPVLIPDGESVLKVDMVIEAMGLGVSDELKDALERVVFTDNGLIKTVGEDSFSTGLDKVFAAGALINGGASVVQCIAEGMKAAEEIDRLLRSSLAEHSLTK